MPVVEVIGYCFDLVHNIESKAAIMVLSDLKAASLSLYLGLQTCNDQVSWRQQS